MLIDGTTSMTRKELTKFYESKAMSVSTYSANNSSGISVTCLKEQLEDALKLVSDICTGSIFPEKELEREKKEIISAIEMQDNEIFEHGYRLLKELIFKEHPYGFQIIGTKDSIGSITKDDIIRFHQNIFTPENMVLGICGDCDSDEIESLVKKYFYSVPLKKSEIGEAQKEPAMDETRQVELRVDKDQSLVLVAFNGIDIYDKDRYTVEVMVDTLASESGVFFKSIRGKAGLSYAQGAFQVLGIHPGYIVIYVLTSKKDIARVKDIIFKELELFIRNGVSEEAMQKSKNHLKSMRQIAMQVNSNFIFAASLDELYGLGYDNYKDYDINIDGVTVGDIKRAAKKILTLDKCAIAIIEGK
jgi:zinc protease